MVNAIDHFCINNKLSGCNFLFVDPQWKELISQLGYSAWMHHSYIWSDQNFHNFEDFFENI